MVGASWLRWFWLACLTLKWVHLLGMDWVQSRQDQEIEQKCHHLSDRRVSHSQLKGEQESFYINSEQQYDMLIQLQRTEFEPKQSSLVLYSCAVANSDSQFPNIWQWYRWTSGYICASEVPSNSPSQEQGNIMKQFRAKTKSNYFPSSLPLHNVRFF